MKYPKRRRERQTCSACVSVETYESRQMLSASVGEVGNIGDDNSRIVPIESVRISLVSDPVAFLAGSPMRTRANLTVVADGHTTNTSDSLMLSPQILIWIDDLTTGERATFFTIRQGAGTSWLKDGHVYRIFARFNGISPWSKPFYFSFNSETTLRPLRDATSFRDAGFDAVLPLSENYVAVGFPLGPILTQPLQNVRDYTVEITNRDSGLVVLQVTKETNSQTSLLELLPDTPTAPGRYSARIRSNVFTINQKDPLTGFLTGSTVQTAWSAPVNFNIVVAPVQIVAGMGSTVDATPMIRWNPVSKAESYEVWIGPPGSSQPTYRMTGIKTRSHNVATPLHNGVYKMWVRAHLPGGGFSTWGAGESLTIGAPLVLETAGRTLTWGHAVAAQKYEIWIDYLGGASAPGAQIVHETSLLKNSYTLSASLPAGLYRAWVRAIRSEGRNVYRSKWSSSVIIQIANDSAVAEQHKLADLCSLITRPLAQIAAADSEPQHPESGTNSEGNTESSLAVTDGVHDVRLITPAEMKTVGEIHDFEMFDFIASGSLDWLSANHSV